MSEGIRPTRAKYDALAEATKKWKAGMAVEEAWLSVDGWKAEVEHLRYTGLRLPRGDAQLKAWLQGSWDTSGADHQDEMRRG